MNAEERLERWLDGELPAAERAVLARDLTGAQGAALREHLRVDLLVRVHGDQAGVERCVAQVRAALGARRPSARARVLRGVGRRLQWHRRVRTWGRVAAVLTVAMLLGLWWASSTPPVMAAGRPLVDGSQVHVASGQTLDLRWPDGSTVDVVGPAHARLHDQRLHLERGLARASVLPQQGTDFRITTAHGVAQVLGTRFSLRAEAAATALLVDEGRVGFAGAEWTAGSLAVGWSGQEPVGSGLVQWSDRRPLGMLWLAQALRDPTRSTGPVEVEQAAKDPAFARRLELLAGHIVNTMRTVNAQGVLVWDLPEAEPAQPAIDRFMATLRAAGLQVGVPISGHGKDAADLAAQLALAVAEARVRWQARLFALVDYAPADVRALELVQQVHPQVLLLPAAGNTPALFRHAAPLRWDGEVQTTPQTVRREQPSAFSAVGVGQRPLGAARGEVIDALRAGDVPLVYAHWIDADVRALLDAVRQGR